MNEQSDHERMIVESVRRFVRREVAPNVAAIEANDDFPQHLIDTMASLGLFGMAVPEDFGGLGLSVPIFASIMEELSAGWSTLPSYLNSHCTVCHLIARFGTDRQRESYLPRLASGSMRAAITLTEPNAGSDLQNISSTALRQADGSFILSGNKIFITNGLRASLYLVLAKTDPQANPAKQGISLILVERDAPGLRVGRVFDKMAFKHVDTAELFFDDTRLGGEAVLGGVAGAGMSQLLDVLEVGRIAIASTAVGLARAALAEAVRFAQDRVAFGAPIVKHQAIQMHLATMATKVAAARALTQEAARVKQSGARADLLAGMAKLFASEAAVEVTYDAVRVHGGYGYVADFPVERMYREAPIYVVTEGTNEIQKVVIARRLLEPGGLTWLGLA